MTNPIRELLNTAKWRDADLASLVLTVRHRGAQDDQRSIGGAAIDDIGAEGFECDDVVIPYHRVLRIERDGRAIWPDVEPVMQPSNATIEVASDDDTRVDAWRELTRDVAVVTGDEDRLRLDGRAGEGGGQVLRSSLTLSMITGRPFELHHIRGGRKKDGLLRQHLTCVRAASEICGAKVQGAELRSTSLVFEPGAVESGSYSFDVGTAGSAALVAQTLLPALALAGGGELTVRGGTHADWAPLAPFLEHAYLPAIAAMGFRCEMETRAYGFYPAGGGELHFRIEHAKPTSFEVVDLGEAPLEAEAIVAHLPESIARRELSMLAERVDEPMRLRASTVRSPGPGNAVWLRASGALTNVFSAVGAKRVLAEDLAIDIAGRYARWRTSGAMVEEYLADQLMVPLALAGGEYTASEWSLHARTNRAVLEAFGYPLEVHSLDEADRSRVRVRKV